jgi:tetratricopeptide (TPR) repeat protein
MLALPALLLLVASTPDAMRAQELLKQGQQLMTSEKFEQAAQVFGQAVALDPLLVLGHHGLGQAHMALRRYPSAVAAFQAARDAYQKQVAADVDRRLDTDRAVEDRIRLLRDRIREAQERVLPAGSPAARQRDMLVQQWEIDASMLQRKYSDPHAIPQVPAFLSLALGSAHFRNRELADAEREYRAALTVRPGLGEALNNLAVVLLLTGRPTEAQAQLRLAEKAGFRVAPGLKSDIDAAVAKLAPSPR